MNICVIVGYFKFGFLNPLRITAPHENNPNFLLLGEAFGLFVFLSILTLIARNENSRYHGLLTAVSAFVLLKKTQIYDIILKASKKRKEVMV